MFTILPFCPSVLWGQLIASHAGWRYCGLLCGLWAAVGFFLTLFFYFPPPRVNSIGLSRREVISQIDFVGGFLSITGMILFMAGMQWGGYQVLHFSYFPRYRLIMTSTNGPPLTYLLLFFLEVGKISIIPHWMKHLLTWRFTSHFSDRFWLLGNLWSQVSYVPISVCSPS